MVSTNIISSVELVHPGIISASQQFWTTCYCKQLFDFRCKFLVLNKLITIYLFLFSVTLLSRSSYSSSYPCIIQNTSPLKTTTTTKILYAVNLWAQFRPFLLGRGYVVQTTHWPWSSCSRKKKKTKRGARNGCLSEQICAYPPFHQ